MTTVAITNTFVNGTTAVAAEVNTNFTDITTYINSNCIVKDGTIAFTAVPTGPATDPSSDNHLTRKLYVDQRTGIATSETVGSTFGPLTAAYQTVKDVSITVPNGKAVKIFAWVTGICSGHNNTAEFAGKVGISLTGAAGGLDYGSQVFVTGAQAGRASLMPMHMLSGTTSAATVLVRFQALQTATFLASAASVFEPCLVISVVPSKALTL